MKINKNRPLIFVTVILLILAVSAISKNKANITEEVPSSTSTPISGNERREYMNSFTVTVPSTMWDQTLENAVILKDKEKEGGEITIFRIGTNYKTLQGYLDDPKLNFNRQKNCDTKASIINDLTSLKCKTNDEVVYFFYVNYTVYSLGTSDKTLYSALDQITQSFQYIGER